MFYSRPIKCVLQSKLLGHHPKLSGTPQTLPKVLFVHAQFGIDLNFSQLICIYNSETGTVWASSITEQKNG